MDSEKMKIMKDTLKVIASKISNSANKGSSSAKWQPPEGFIYEKLSIDKILVDHIFPKEKNSKDIILHFHGGGYVIPNGDLFRHLSIKYSKVAKGAEVFNVDYRLAPKDCYPAALEDAVKVYKWLLKEGYNNENIIIAGDSAGANLSLALTLYLKDKNIALPKGVMVLSPWTNVANDFPSIKYNFDKDIILGKYGEATRTSISNSSYFKEVDVKNDVYASPVLGDFKGFPNLLIQAGAYEMLLDDAKVLADKAKEAGVNVTFKIYDEMPHDFMIIFGQLQESKDAWEEIEKFIKELN